MTNNELLERLLKSRDLNAPRFGFLNAYYQGTQKNGFLTPIQRKLLGDRLSHLSVNIPRLAVGEIAQRLHVQGFTGLDIWQDWLRCDCDQIQDTVHKEALAMSVAYVVVWGDELGRPVVTAESASSVAVLKNPGTGVIEAALKVWHTENTTAATLFTPDEVVRLRADNSSARDANSFRVIERLDNPLGVVPVVEFANMDRFTPHSEITDIADLVDGLNLALADLAISQAHNARPVPWATGIALEERPVLDDDGNPVLDDDGNPVVELINPVKPRPGSALVSDNENAKFGQLDGSSLSGFEAAVRIWLSAIQAVTSLPASALGILSDQPNSADSLRAASQGLEAKAQNRSGSLGRSWEQVARLMYAIRNPGVDVASLDVRVVWRSFGVTSEGMAVDAVVKLHQAGLLSVSGALSRLGYTQDEIDAERAARRAEALDSQGITLPSRTAPDTSTGTLDTNATAA